jgi:hypothetical protein
MNIKVSHESPLCLLKDSLTYNDYDYALVHLFEHENTALAEAYFDFFKNSVKDNRVVYLDNSIFELGESFETGKYVEWVQKLQPTVYIVPDVLESAPGTIDSFINWFSDLSTNKSEALNTMAMGVVQGADWNDLVACYKFMSANADMIAISFDYSYYLSTGDSTLKYYNQAVNSGMYKTLRRDGDLYLKDIENPMDCSFCKDKLHRYMTGRQRFIKQLIAEGIWNWNKPHHLLGCSLPQEFNYYVKNNIHNIHSVDTSNPVMAGLHWYKYHDTLGLQGKPAGLMAELMGMDPTDAEFAGKRQAVLYNTDCFKKIINREPLYDNKLQHHAAQAFTYTQEMNTEQHTADEAVEKGEGVH